MLKLVCNIFAMLCLCCMISCSSDFKPDVFPTALPRPPAGPVIDLYPYCSDSVSEGLWATNCVEMCIPSIATAILCHGNNEKHAIANTPNLNWIATLEPAELSNCKTPAYRVWSVKLDTRPPEIKDRDIFSTWFSETTYCTALKPGQFFETDFFVKHNDIFVYLLNESEEVIPYL